MIMDCGNSPKTNERPETGYRSAKDECGPKAAFVTRLEAGAQATCKLHVVCELGCMITRN